MKKIFVITLAGLLAFSMTACGDKAPEKDPVDTESSIMEVTPSYEKYTVVCKIDNEKASEMFGQVKDMLNKMNEAYEAGETDFSKFVSSKADPQLAVTIATCVTNQYTWNDSLSPWNIRFTIVEGLSEYEGKAYIPAELLQDDVVTMVLKSHPPLKNAGRFLKWGDSS